MLQKYDLSLINSRLFGLYGLFISVSVSFSSFLAYLMLFLVLLEGNLKEKWFEIKNNFFIYSVLIFVLLHFLGLMWTEDFSWAQTVLKREWKLLFIVLFMMIVKKEHFKYYIKMFIIGMSISEFVSYLIWFQVVPPFMYATVENPTPFMKHLSYNIYLAIAIYFFLWMILFDKSINYFQKSIMTGFLLTMTVNMFITGGRAGQVACLLLLFTLIIKVAKMHLKKALFLFMLIVSTFVVAYHTSPLFFERANKAINEVIHFEHDHTTSVGTRIALMINSVELIKENLLYGVGTGDLLQEYAKINEKSKYQTPIMHPHNMYLLMMIEFGIIGLLVLLFLFLTKIKISFLIEDEFQNFRFGFIVLFLVVMLSNSYLYTHHTMVLYIFFTSFLFKKT